MTDCIFGKYGLNGDGYSHFQLNNKHYRTHKYLYEQQYGKVPEGKVLDHLCKNRACINTSHLEVVSQAENCRRGALAKITYSDVENIRNDFKSKKMKRKEIAEKYNLTYAHVSDIVTMRRWLI